MDIFKNNNYSNISMEKWLKSLQTQCFFKQALVSVFLSTQVQCPNVPDNIKNNHSELIDSQNIYFREILQQKIDNNKRLVYEYQKDSVKYILDITKEVRNELIHDATYFWDREYQVLIQSIPNSIILAQAIIEGGWMKNENENLNRTRNMFGLICTNGKPQHFSNYHECMITYFRNLLTYPIYEHFRKALLEENNTPLWLINYLGVYNENPKAYIQKLKRIIQDLWLMGFDSNSLVQPQNILSISWIVTATW